MIRVLVQRLGIVAVLGLLFCAAIPTNQSTSAIRISGERRINFNDHWRFHKGEASGAENPTFNDSSWAEVRLPHDWAIEGPFDPKLNPHTGALPISGTGWYRKSFFLSENAKGRYFSIAFDGAISTAVVSLHAHALRPRPYPYATSSFHLTSY